VRYKLQTESRRENPGRTAARDETPPAPLDVVIPVTTPELTRAGIKAAERLAAGLYAQVRLVRIQIVPYPLQLGRPPVPVDFLQEQLHTYGSVLSLKREIRLARDFEPALIGALRPGSLVIIAAKKRRWRTANEQMAAALQRAGYSVLIAFEGENHA
jgi:hypothetical protein